MCFQWHRLAEVQMQFEGESNDYKIFCLCTRVFVRDHDLYNLGIKGVPLSDEDEDEADDADRQEGCMTEGGRDEVCLHDNRDEDSTDHLMETEQNTDQKIETGENAAEMMETMGNEHLEDTGENAEDIALMQQMGLPLSFETSNSKKQSIGKNHKKKKKLKNNKTRQKKNCRESNDKSYCNSTQEKGVYSDMQEGKIRSDEGQIGSAVEEGWQAYWAEHGEQLVWQGWLEKYPEYIDHEVLQQMQVPYVKEEVVECVSEDVDEGAADTRWVNSEETPTADTPETTTADAQSVRSQERLSAAENVPSNQEKLPNVCDNRDLEYVNCQKSQTFASVQGSQDCQCVNNQEKSHTENVKNFRDSPDLNSQEESENTRTSINNKETDEQCHPHSLCNLGDPSSSKENDKNVPTDTLSIGGTSECSEINENESCNDCRVQVSQEVTAASLHNNHVVRVPVRLHCPQDSHINQIIKDTMMCKSENSLQFDNNRDSADVQAASENRLNSESVASARMVQTMHDYCSVPSDGREQTEQEMEDVRDEAAADDGEDAQCFDDQWRALWDEHYMEIYWYYYNQYVLWHSDTAEQNEHETGDGARFDESAVVEPLNLGNSSHSCTRGTEKSQVDNNILYQSQSEQTNPCDDNKESAVHNVNDSCVTNNDVSTEEGDESMSHILSPTKELPKALETSLVLDVSHKEEDEHGPQDGGSDRKQGESKLETVP